LKRYGKLFKFIGLILIIAIVAGGAGFGVYKWQANNSTQQTKLDTSFVQYESGILPEGAKDIKTGPIEKLNVIFSRQFQFSDKDGQLYLVTAIEVGSGWVNAKVEKLNPPVSSVPAPAPAPSTTPAPTSTP